MHRRVLVSIMVTFVLFTGEALIHFSIGAGRLALPDIWQSLELLGTIMLFSVMSALVTHYINYHWPEAKQRVRSN